MPLPLLVSRLSILCCVALLASCGDNAKAPSASATGSTQAAEPALKLDTAASAPVIAATITLKSISVSSSDTSIGLGETTALQATGLYTDNSSKDLSSKVSWLTNKKGVIGIATGKAKGIGAGVVQITAKLDGVTSSPLSLTVGYSIGGSVHGLASGNSLSLTNNGIAEEIVTNGDTFILRNRFTPKTAYDIQVTATPNAQPCTQTYGKGNVPNANVHNIQVICGYPSKGISTASADITNARRSHTATLLPNGKLLIVGGADNTGSIASAELLDVANNKWAVTSPLSQARRSHSATLLPNGKVLIAGGIGEDVTRLSSAEMFDPASAKWEATGNLNIARRDHTATLLPNGKVLVVGGIGATGQGILSSAELFDPATGQWSATSNLAAARTQHTATLLPNGKVLIVGGTGAKGSLNNAELYDSNTGTWSSTGKTLAPRYLHTATLLPSGKVLIAGGLDDKGSLASSELFDANNGQWTASGKLADARYSHSAVLLPTGNVYVTGGSSAGGKNILASAEIFDPATGQWSTTGKSTQARSQHTTVLLSNGTAITVGGTSGGEALRSVESYW